MHLQGERGEEESKPGSQAGKALLQEERKKVAGFREKPVLSVQPTLLTPYPWETVPGGRGLSLSLAPSWGLVVTSGKGLTVGWSGSLEKPAPAGKNREKHLKEKAGCPQGNVATEMSSLLARSPQWPYFKYML